MCLTRELAHQHAIEDMKYDPFNARLGSVAGGEAKLWNIDTVCKYPGIPMMYFTNFTSGMLRPFPQRIPGQEYITRSIHFIEDGQAILLCYLESHEM